MRLIQAHSDSSILSSMTHMRPSILIQHLVLKIRVPGPVHFITLTPSFQILAKRLRQMNTKNSIRHGKETRNIPLKHILDGKLYPSENPLMVLTRKHISQSLGFTRRKRCLPPGKVHTWTDDTTARGVMDNSVNACMSNATFQIA